MRRLLLLCTTALVLGLAIAVAPPPRAAGSSASLSGLDWTWPAEPVRIVAPFVQPAHAYGSGHRGIDLEVSDAVRAPADGIVAFAGPVAGRGVLTIDHGGGLVTTLEPVQTSLPPGAPVRRGEAVANVARGGHAPDGSVHVGVRWNGEYVNPMLLLAEIPRAVLLPCCAGQPTALRAPASFTVATPPFARTELSLPSKPTDASAPPTATALRSPRRVSVPSVEAPTTASLPWTVRDAAAPMVSWTRSPETVSAPTSAFEVSTTSALPWTCTSGQSPLSASVSEPAVSVIGCPPQSPAETTGSSGVGAAFGVDADGVDADVGVDAGVLA